MNELQIFKNEEFGLVRTAEIDGKTYFVAKDVANALGYSNPRDAISRHCKGVVKHDSFKEGGQEISLIPEGDIYRLVIKSQLPNADRFECWVFDEVIPSIRENGAYMTRETLDKALTSPDFLIELATKLKEKQKQIDELNGRVIEQDKRIMIQDSVINEMKPKVSYYDMILDNKSTVLVTQIAQDYGMSAKGFNKMLKDMGVQHKVGGQWILYSRYQGNGYVHSKTFDFERSNGIKDVNMNTEWTQKGRLFLYDFLKKHNILPLIEREV